MSVINEHPDKNVRKLYAGEVASHVGIPAADLMSLAERGSRKPVVAVAAPARSTRRENAEFVAIALLIQQWDDIAPWMVEALFQDDVYRRAFLALAETQGVVNTALELADPEAREAIERAAVADVDSEPMLEALNLISAAVRRELTARVKISDPEQIRLDRDAAYSSNGWTTPLRQTRQPRSCSTGSICAFRITYEEHLCQRLGPRCRSHVPQRNRSSRPVDG
jgi:DNA primase